MNRKLYIFILIIGGLSFLIYLLYFKNLVVFASDLENEVENIIYEYNEINEDFENELNEDESDYDYELKDYIIPLRSTKELTNSYDSNVEWLFNQDLYEISFEIRGSFPRTETGYLFRYDDFGDETLSLLNTFIENNSSYKLYDGANYSNRFDYLIAMTSLISNTYTSALQTYINDNGYPSDNLTWNAPDPDPSPTPDPDPDLTDFNFNMIVIFALGVGIGCLSSKFLLDFIK